MTYEKITIEKDNKIFRILNDSDRWIFFFIFYGSLYGWAAISMWLNGDYGRESGRGDSL